MNISRDNHRNLKHMYGNAIQNSELELEWIFKPVHPKSHSVIHRDEFQQIYHRLLHPSLKLKPIENPESLDIIVRNSDIRTTIIGLPMIQRYCKTNSVKDIPSSCLHFMEKTRGRDQSVLLSDYNLKCNLKYEKKLESRDSSVNSLKELWSESTKAFRLKKRYSFRDQDNLIQIDLTIIRQSERLPNGSYRFVTNFEDASISGQNPSYEVELEFVGNKKGKSVDGGLDGDADEKKMSDLHMLQHSVKYLGFILQVSQNSNSVASKSQVNAAFEEYRKLLDSGYKSRDSKHGHDWIGPQPASMNLDHIRHPNGASEKDQGDGEKGWDNIVSIHSGYAVTPKADGDRAMLFISRQGLFLLYRRMEMSFTGLKWENCHGTLLDGEFVTVNKKGQKVRKYLIFDIYFLQGRDVRGLPFWRSRSDIKEHRDTGKGIPSSRYELIQQLCDPVSAGGLGLTEINHPGHLTISIKPFSFGKTRKTDDTKFATDIFQKSKEMLEYIDKNDEDVDYPCDGLVFIPYEMAVGGEYPVKSLIKQGELNTKKQVTFKHERFDRRGKPVSGGGGEDSERDEEKESEKESEGEIDEESDEDSSKSERDSYERDEVLDVEVEGEDSAMLGGSQQTKKKIIKKKSVAKEKQTPKQTPKQKPKQRSDRSRTKEDKKTRARDKVSFWHNNVEYYTGGTWHRNLKWKPSQDNTIDFLVEILKEGDDNHDKIGYRPTSDGVQKYKTVILKTGFNTLRHESINICRLLLEGDEAIKPDSKHQYLAKEFKPTHPPDKKTFLANIPLVKDSKGIDRLVCRNGDEISDDTIIEMSYDITQADGWKWKPRNVRWDKTSQLRGGASQYGNDYDVAHDIWKGYHNPITTDMISGKSPVPSQMEEENRYYARMITRDRSLTRPMLDFHNLYVKSNLISGAISVCPNAKLLDLACGKAGDLNKWIDSIRQGSGNRVSKIVGVDIAQDNIENSQDGACLRYQEAKSRYYRKQPGGHFPEMYFLVGNSALDIPSGEAAVGAMAKKEAKAEYHRLFQILWGNRGIKKSSLDGVYQNMYGAASDGFDIVSIQFALHYFFRDLESLHGLVENVVRNTRLNGYFIGTCFDGQSVYDRLEHLEKDEYIRGSIGGSTLWKIQKKFETPKTAKGTPVAKSRAFPSNQNSLGKSVVVYMETINQYLEEYLVNFEYFTKIMNQNGFNLVDAEKASEMGLPGSTGLFNQMFTQLQSSSRSAGQARDMNKIDQEFSFMNRWFLFQKQEEHSTIKGFGKMAKRKPVTLDVDDVEKDDMDKKVNDDSKTEEEPKKKKKIIRKKRS